FGRHLLAASMLLTTPQISLLAKSPAAGVALGACARHEESLRVHTDVNVDPDARPVGLERLLTWPKAVLPKDKFEKLVAFIPNPLPTTELVDTVFTGLGRVFDAQDGSVTTDFESPEAETDFETYRTALGDESFWRGEAFTALRRAPHSVLVVDMATEQLTPRPAPYVYLLDIAQVVDLALKPDATLEYLMFRQSDYRREDGEIMQRLAVYDDGFYRLYEREESATEWPSVPILENPHSLGYTPARLLWGEALAAKTDLPRRGPLTSQLGKLNRFPIWEACIEFFQMYGVMPILWSVKEQCDYAGPSGETCAGGFVQYLIGYSGEGESRYPRYEQKACPSCERNKYMGPGTHVEVPGPTKEVPNTHNPLGWVSADVAVLKEIWAVHEQRRASIVAGCLGGGGEASNDQAMNDKQVRAQFEHLQDVLMWVKSNLEQAQSWTLTTIGKLRYGPLCRQVVANRGEQFYLKSPEQLAAQEAQDRKAGRSVSELSRARDLRYATEYRGNPAMLDRMRILSDLEPWSETSLDVILDKVSAAPAGSPMLALYPTDKLALKADFPRYLAQFESQHGDVRQFGSLQPYWAKLKLITSLLLSYVNPVVNPTPQN
ncbi:MAG TPA: hypothetical protein VF690_12310, partial [Hymenobacter sp.]